MKMSIDDLRDKTTQSLESMGMKGEFVAMVADVFARATGRGVGHHDISSLYGRVKSLKEGKANKNPDITKIGGFGAVENYDGDNGLGEVCTYFATMKSMDLAEKNGIGFCTIRNSNHFLSAAPYSEMAAEQGYLSIVMSKSISGLAVGESASMGNSPFGYAADYTDGRIIFDICLAYASNGKLNDLAGRNQKVPLHWGRDTDGNATDDPAQILKSGLGSPIGEHKGFGLALLIEMLTAVLGKGSILKEGAEQSGLKGQYSQSVISICIDRVMGSTEFGERNQRMIDMLKESSPAISIPGEGSKKRAMADDGFFEIDDDLFRRIQSLIES